MQKFPLLEISILFAALFLFSHVVQGREQKGPSIGEVKFSDPQGVLDDFEKALLYSQKGLQFDEGFLQWDREKIESYLRHRGYYFARVTAVKKRLTSGRVSLVFAIHSGPRVYIEKVHFTPGQPFEEEKLQEVFFSALTRPPYAFYNPWRWFGFQSTPLYIPSETKRAVKKLEQFYRSRGYWENRVKVRKKHFSTPRRQIMIEIKIDPGPRYQWGKIEVQGPRKDASLFRELSGRPFELSHLKKRVEKIQKKWRQRGYFQGKINYQFQPRKKEKKIHARLTINRGPLTLVGRITFRGHHTKDSVLRRYLKVAPGEVLTEEKLRQSRQNLRATRFFRKIRFRLQKSDIEGARDLEIEVEEAKDGRIQALGGFSSELGVFGGAGFEIRNFDIGRFPLRTSEWARAFRGGGQYLKLSSFWGERASRSQALFREPFLFGSEVGLTTEFHFQEWKFLLYQERRWGTGLTFFRQYDHFRLEFGYGLEDTRYPRLDPSLPSEVFAAVKDLRASYINMGGYLYFRGRRASFSLGADLTIGHSYWGSEADYTKSQLRIRLRFPLVFDLFYQGEFRAGWGRLFSGEELPYALRYFLGGHSTVRGFDFQGLGPQPQNFPLGGSAFWLARQEIHYPLLSWLSVIAFVDMGDLGGDLNIFGHGFPRLTLGGGVRWYLFSRDLPLALDFGQAIVSRPEDDERLVSFALELIF